MANVKKTQSELRTMAAELTEKAKMMLAKADLLEQEEGLKLLKAIKKAGKLEAVKQLLAKPDASPAVVAPKTMAAKAAVQQSAQLETLMSSSFEDVQ